MGNKATNRARTYDYVDSKVRVGGEALAPEGEELNHGDQVYFLARGHVNEVSFPEDKDGNINRVAKMRLEKGFIVSPEEAEHCIAEERERRTGQGNLIAEIKRSESEKVSTDVEEEDALPTDDEPEDDDEFEDDEEDEDLFA